MTQEEKAKAYDEVIERAKKVLLDCTSEEQKVVEYITPELKESEDERIRKRIVDIINGALGVRPTETEQKELLTWLEKQGEQKPNPCENCGIATNNCQKSPCVIRDGEQKPADKVEPKFKVGDWVAYDGWHCQITEVREDGYCNSMNGFIPKEREDSMHLIITEPAWSEEDENRINRLIAYFEDKESFTAEDDIVYANWLKSLKERYCPRPQWKPTEEQMRVLECAYGNGYLIEIDREILGNLYDQLKEL